MSTILLRDINFAADWIGLDRSDRVRGQPQ